MPYLWGMNLRFLLFPFAFLYGAVTIGRNVCYELKLFKSYTSKLPVISIGNLSAGGTGKSPLVKYIAQTFSSKFHIAILSRGYKRQTKGFRWVSKSDEVTHCGDEPLMYARSLPEKVSIAVCENRADGIHVLEQAPSAIECILLDDAFQHRKVLPKLNILVTEYHKPFFEDFLLPSGNLRETRSGAHRAHLLLVSKCPSNLNEQDKTHFIRQTHFTPENVYFSSILYGHFVPKGKRNPNVKSIVLVTGIGNPSPLLRELESTYNVSHLNFPDHHPFTRADILKIHRKFGTFASDESIILTTEKDWMRLEPLLKESDLVEFPWQVVPIQLSIDREDEFKKRIYECIRTI